MFLGFKEIEAFGSPTRVEFEVLAGVAWETGVFEALKDFGGGLAAVEHGKDVVLKVMGQQMERAE